MSLPIFTLGTNQILNFAQHVRLLGVYLKELIKMYMMFMQHCILIAKLSDLIF